MKAFRALLWTMVNGALLAGLWFGLAEGYQGALNLGLFLTWVAIISSMFMLSERVVDEFIKQHGGRSVPAPLSWIVDSAVILILAWHGWLWTAGFYLLAAAIQHGALMQGHERVAKAAGDAS